MPKPKAQLPWFGLMAALALFLLPEACIAGRRNKDCGFTLCGDVNISYPFRLTSQPRECGVRRLELECDSNNRTTLAMKYGRFYVQNISYVYHTIQVIDANLGRNDCSLPRSSFISDNQQTKPRDFDQFCTVEARVPVELENISNVSTLDIYEKLLLGFELSWRYFDDHLLYCAEDKLQVM
ncbi:Wall-associated receptor kinase [Theobroma cacao]|nr:Wall-associated receptor kinase [Theobroma cacao]